MSEVAPVEEETRSHPAPFPEAPIEPSPAARKRLGLVAALYGYRTLASLLVAAPISLAVSWPTALFPRGPAELFDPGGLMLLESLRAVRRSPGPWMASTITLSVVAALAGVLPLGALIAGLGRQGSLPRGYGVSRALAHLGTLILDYGLGLLAQVITAALVMVLGAKLIEVSRVPPPGEDLAYGAALLMAFIAASVVGVIRDLAMVSAVHRGLGFYDAGVRAMHALSFGALGAWAWRATLGLLGLAAATALAPSLTGGSRAALLLSLLLHQAAIFGMTYARASWLAAAITRVDRASPQ